MADRVGREQVETLLDYLQHHPLLVKGVGLGARSKETIERQWDELASLLNSFGSGATKTGLRWKRYWIDLKHKVRSRAVQRRRDAVGTGGGPPSQDDLSETDKKVLAIIGVEAVFGDVEHRVPLFNPGPSSDPASVGSRMSPLDNPQDIAGPSSSRSPPVEVQYEECSEQPCSTEQPPPPSRKDSPVPKLPPTKQPRLQKATLRKSSQTTKVDTAWVIELERKRVAAEEKLANAAMIVAEAAKSIAEAVKIQAEAAKVQAEAAKVQAEAALAHNKNTEQLVELIKQQQAAILDTLKDN